MKVVGLLSGGKDSCYNLCHCAKQGHEIVALATLAPPEGKDELDSYMYQTVGHDAVHLVAEAMGLPLYRRVITGQPLQTGASFGVASTSGSDDVNDKQTTAAARDETEDMYELLMTVKSSHPDIQAVSVGAILSNYQRFRVETICARPDLNLQPLAYLWQRSQSELLNEMVQARVEAVLIKVAGIGLDERDLGKSLAQMQAKFTRLNSMYGAHVCGEGGEYETLTLDCPLFKKRIQLDQTDVVVHSGSASAFDAVAYLRMSRASLVDKVHDQQSTLDAVVVPPVLDIIGTRTLKAAQSVGEPSASDRAPLAPLSPLARSPRTPLRPATHRKGKWTAFHDVTASKGATDTREQEVQSAFQNLRDELSKHNLSLAHCQHINLSLQSQGEFKEINTIYKAQFSVEPPSRATVALPQPHRVTLDGWAYDDGSTWAADTHHQLQSGTRSIDRQALHVQGLSYWASANIGPYSQAVLSASRMTIAGQIGLLPVDLSLSDETMQYALSLQHARRIFEAVLDERSRRGKGWIEGGICWIATGPDIERRIKTAKACWDSQTRYDDDDEGDGCWLLGSEGVQGTTELPMLYAQVASDALPRNAVVEWQLTGHDGKRRVWSQDDDEEEDENTEADRPDVDNGHFVIAFAQQQFNATHQSITCPTGQSSHGILTLSMSDGAASATPGDDVVAALAARLHNALSVKFFVDVSRDHEQAVTSAQTILEELVGHSRAYSTVPTFGLWTSNDTDAVQQWQVAIVWHDVE